MTITKAERKTLLRLEALARESLKAAFALAPSDPTVLEAYGQIQEAHPLIVGAIVRENV